jgi:hypothetical protein
MSPITATTPLVSSPPDKPTSLLGRIGSNFLCFFKKIGNWCGRAASYTASCVWRNNSSSRTHGTKLVGVGHDSPPRNSNHPSSATSFQILTTEEKSQCVCLRTMKANGAPLTEEQNKKLQDLTERWDFHTNKSKVKEGGSNISNTDRPPSIFSVI